MTSSFARLLGASPSSFSLHISLRSKEEDVLHDHVITFSWTDVEVRRGEEGHPSSRTRKHGIDEPLSCR